MESPRRKLTLTLIVVAVWTIAWTAILLPGCGSSDDQSVISTKSDLLVAAELACDLEARREPSVSYVPEVPCVGEWADYTCCIAPGDRASEYVTEAFHINLVGSERCREWIDAHTYCEYENAVTWQNGVGIDRCVKSC